MDGKIISWLHSDSYVAKAGRLVLLVLPISEDNKFKIITKLYELSNKESINERK